LHARATAIDRFEEVESMREFAALLDSRETWKLKRETAKGELNG
jgi:hypothetical protein